MNLFSHGLVTFTTAIGVILFLINDYYDAKQWPASKATLDSSNRQDDALKAEFWIRIHWIRIRIQGFDDQNFKKKIQLKGVFLSKIAIY